MMKVIRRGTIPKDPAYSLYPSNTFCSIEALPSGRWLASFRIATTKGSRHFNAMMTYSDNQGATWASWYEPVRLPLIDGREGMSICYYCVSLGGSRVLALFNWVDGSISDQPFYDPVTESLKDTYIFSIISEDEGITWSEPKRVHIGSDADPVALTGSPLLLGDGRLACHFEINKNRKDTRTWIHRSAMIFSADQGSTWDNLTLVTDVPDMYYWDQRPCVTDDGKTLVDFFWPLDGKRNTYLNIHAKESRDAGRTWGELWDTGIYGQPGRPVDCALHGLACIDIDRSTRPVITVRLSDDRARTWSESLVIYDSAMTKQDSKQISMNEAWAEMARFSVGHPHLLKLSENRLLAYSYAGEHCDDTSISYVMIGFDDE